MKTCFLLKVCNRLSYKLKRLIEMEPVLKFEKRIDFNNNICKDFDMSLVVETVEQSTKNECLICMNEGANVICKHCNNIHNIHIHRVNTQGA